MNESKTHTLGGRQLGLGCTVFFILGVLAMIYFQAGEVMSQSKYHRDLTQSPHWAAYHGDAFPEDDLLRQYAAFNESPIQNIIYWTGTLFVHVIPLNKIVGITFFGLTAALFFLLVTRMSGPRVGILAALFFIIFPRSSYEIAGGFSKAWAIGFLLLSTYVVEKRSWRILIWAMPLAALAYPISPVLMGAIVFIGLVLEYPGSSQEAWRGLKFLVGGSALALIPLLYKYFTPPDFIGDMISSSRMKEMWEDELASESTLPLWEDVLGYIEYPFFILGTILIFMLLGHRSLIWKRSWTAVVIASTISYFIADLLIPQLYLPNRYTRYSTAVLIVLWNAHNWAQMLERFKSRRWAWPAGIVLIVIAALSFPKTFTPCKGKKSQGIWEDRTHLTPVSQAIAKLPQPVFIAGHPADTACVMLQSGRPVLTINRMFHHWFDKYRDTIDQRHRDIFRAFYARKVEDVNQLAETYGVTHFLVRKSGFHTPFLQYGNIYRIEYEKYIRRLTSGVGSFVLDNPPSDTVEYTDQYYRLIRLPMKK